MRIAAVVLAAGQSRRFGSPKPLARAGERTLIETAVRAAASAGCRPVVVVTGAHRAPVEAAVAPAAVETVWNPDWEEGMGASIRAGIAHLEAAEPVPDAVVLLACDQPGVGPETVRRLVEAFRPPATTLVACSYAGITGIPALFGWGHAPELLRLSWDAGARAVLERHRGRLRAVACPEAEADVDCPEDLDRLPPGRRGVDA